MSGVGITIKLVALVSVTPFTDIVILPVDAPTGTITVRLVAVASVIVAITSLNFTTFPAGNSLKFVPMMVTVAPAAPLKGLKLVIVGVASTVKSELLETVIPFNVSVIFPVVAPVGTVVLMLEEVAAVTTLVTPLNLITLLAGVVLKFVPVMLTVAPGAPLSGVKLTIDGVGKIVKLPVLVMVTPLVVTETGPVAVPAGTVTVMVVAVEAVTVATTPLKDTALLVGVVLKFVPFIVTVAPTAPDEGLRLVMVGLGNTVKSDVLVMVMLFTVTEILPVVAPVGTMTVMLVFVDDVTAAIVLLNLTIWSVGVVLKFVPLMITSAPAAPVVGLKLVIVGVGNTTKSEVLVPVTPPTVTEIFPVLAPAGTTVVILVVVDAVTLATTPLNLTTLLAGTLLKLVPVNMTIAPGAPLAGLKSLITGVGTVKLDALVPVIPFTVTEIFPVVAPKGTEVVILVVVDAVTTLVVPLNCTVFSEGTALKLVPVIVTTTL